MERSKTGTRAGDRSVVSQSKLAELAGQVDPKQVLDDDVQDVLLQLADDFVESAVSASCGLAKHRKSGVLEVKDLSVYLDSAWNMTMPGFSDETAPAKKSTATEAHKQRLNQIKKSKR